MSKKHKPTIHPMPDIDLFLEQEADLLSAEVIQGMSQLVQSAIELTKLAVSVEQTQQSLDRNAVFAIYDQAMQHIASSLRQMFTEPEY